MKIFLDNCLSPRFAKALQVLAEIQDYEIVHLSEKFPRETPDVVWLRQLGREGDWIIVSGDPRISRNRAEQRVWHESGLTAFFFGKGGANRSYWNLAADLVPWWPTIILEARQAPAGSGYLIPPKGKQLQKIYDP